MDLLDRITQLLTDRSPKSVGMLRYIQDILDGKVVIPGGIMKLMNELAWDYVNPEIDDAHFPGADPFVSSEGVVPVQIPMDRWYAHQAIAYLAQLKPPMRPVKPDRGIKWAANNPDAQRRESIAIIGQQCRNYRRACLSGDGRDSRYGLALFTRDC